MRKTKIVIDGRMISESGIGRYIKNLISELQIIDNKNEYFVLHLKKDFESLEYQGNFHKILADCRWYGAYEQIKLLGVLRSLMPDLTHFPHFNVPIFYTGKYIVTIHDLIHQHFSMQRASTHGRVVYKIKQIGYRMVFKNAISKSLKILVPSYFVKSALLEDWKVNAGKIVVTKEAVEEKLLRIIKRIQEQDIEGIMKKFNIKSPFLFYVGNAHPHKNVEGLIRVFMELREKHPGLLLVLSGNDHYFWQKIKKEFSDRDIIYTGYITDEELVALYKKASCFVMPSFEEGFGIPVLEAMASSCPVVSSSAGSLKEVGGDAAIYFDPGNIKEMGNKIDMVLTSETIQKDLVAKGKVKVKDFSWKKLAEQTLEVYEQCALQ